MKRNEFKKYLPENYDTMSDVEIINRYKNLKFQQKMLILCYDYETILSTPQKIRTSRFFKTPLDNKLAYVTITTSVFANQPTDNKPEFKNLITNSLGSLVCEIVAFRMEDDLREKPILTGITEGDEYWFELLENLYFKYES